MARGDKSAYPDKQKRMAEHIEEGYEERGVPPKEAAARAWATVNKQDRGGRKSGSGRGKKRRPINRPSKRRGAAKKAAATRKKKATSTRSKKKATRTRKATAKRTRTTKKTASRKKAASR